MKEKQTLEEFINSQPYYGHGTPEYLEGIEVGAKWQQEQELDRLKEAYSMGIMGKSIKEFNKTFKQQEQ
jgi:hypothetical protein